MTQNSTLAMDDDEEWVIDRIFAAFDLEAADSEQTLDCETAVSEESLESVVAAELTPHSGTDGDSTRGAEELPTEMRDSVISAIYALGGKVLRSGTGEYVVANCPGHEERSATLRIELDDPTRFFCDACERGGGVVEFLALASSCFAASGVKFDDKNRFD